MGQIVGYIFLAWGIALLSYMLNHLGNDYAASIIGSALVVAAAMLLSDD